MRVLGFALALASAAAAADPGDPVRFVRGSQTIAEALDQIGGLAGTAEAKALVFVFEQGDFGTRERSYDEPDYRAQLPAWLDGIAAMAEKHDGQIRVALTGSSKPFAVRNAPALLDEAKRAYGVPPDRWLPKLARFPKGKNGAVVYVSGAPQQYAYGFDRPPWDPEQVAAALRRSGARLYVIMPEARFFDFLPTREFVDLPDMWWCVPGAGSLSREFHSRWAWDTDCPSAYGVAAYARAAAATGGAYVFYPGKATDWLDPCPFNAGLLTELLPRMLSAEQTAAAAVADPVLKEIAESTRRCKPLAAFGSDFSVPPRDATKLARLALSARANADLCAAEADRLAAVGRAVEAGELKGASRRSLAQLRYSRFVLECASFHSAAWAEAAETVEAFVEKGEGREAYERSGLKVRLWSDIEIDIRDVVAPIKEYERKEPRFVLRQIDELPASLRARAPRVVAAAEDVMKHEALSPWGWMVYYSSFCTFVPEWVGEGKEPKRRKPASKEKPPETPPDPKPAPGSGGSGPTTGG